jgi:hypothetical protein
MGKQKHPHTRKPNFRPSTRTQVVRQQATVVRPAYPHNHQPAGGGGKHSGRHRVGWPHASTGTEHGRPHVQRPRLGGGASPRASHVHSPYAVVVATQKHLGARVKKVGCGKRRPQQ